MHRDNATAQVATLREWADQWDREALGGSAEGYAEVAFLMRKAANAAQGAVGIQPPQPVTAAVETLQRAEPVADTREG